MNERQSTKRLPYLDSARGLAAVSVITFHFFFAVYGSGLRAHYGSVSHLFWYGEANVIFFFIHSGFILAYAYAGGSAKLSLNYYIRFLIERIFRIYPLFLFILVVSFVAINNTPAYQYGTGEGYVELFWLQKAGWRDLLNQSLLVVRVPDSANLRLIPQDWTLTVELLAGAAIPLLAFAGKRALLLFVGILAVLKAGNFLTTYIFEFGLGVFLFLVRDHIIKAWQRCNMFVRVMIGLLSILFYSCFFIFPAFFSGEIVFIDPRYDRVIVGLGCVLFFVVLLSSAKMQRILSLPFLVGIGRVCYSIYLLHEMLIFIFWRQWGDFLHQLQEKNVFIIALAYIAYLTLVILLAKLLFRIIEHPMNLLGKKIAGKITAK